jgi:hypothetical protein
VKYNKKNTKKKLIGTHLAAHNPNLTSKMKLILTAKSMHSGYHSAHSGSIAKEITKFRTRTNGNTVEIGLYKGRGRDNVKRADCMENFFWEPHQADHWTQQCFNTIVHGELKIALMTVDPKPSSRSYHKLNASHPGL